MNLQTFVRWNAALTLILASALTTPLFAFPAPPLPLYELWKRSDVILFADVISAVSEGPQQRANVSVAAILKGDAAQLKPVLTVFTRLGGCPYPHRFKANERVLLFLAWDSDQLMFTPVGSSEAVIVTDAAGVKKFQSQFDELPEIYKLASEEQIRAALLRWSVRCVLEPHTRPQGLTTLGWVQPQDSPIQRWLLPDEAERLVDAIASESPGNDAAGIVELLIAYPSPRIDQLLLASLRKCEDDAQNPIARVALQHLPERLSLTLSAELRERLDGYWKRESDFYWGGEERSKREKKMIKKSLDTEFGWLCANVWRECSSHLETRSKR